MKFQRTQPPKQYLKEKRYLENSKLLNFKTSYKSKITEPVYCHYNDNIYNITESPEQI